MAYVGIQLLVGVTLASVADTFVKVDCKRGVVGHYGQQSTLQCIVRATQGATDTDIRVVTWRKMDETNEPPLVFHNGKVESQPGFRFAEPSWGPSNMNISLLITNTAVAHGGDYECLAVTESGDDKSTVSFSVRAEYSKPTIRSVPETISPNAEPTLVCSSNGGYPKGELRWFDVDNYEWTKSAQMQATPTAAGLYNLTSKLTPPPGAVFSKFTCLVYSASGSKEGEATFNMPPIHSELGGDKDRIGNSKIVAPVVVIGSIIVGLLILILLLYRRRVRSARRHSMVPLMGELRAIPANDNEDQLHEDRMHQDGNV